MIGLEKDSTGRAASPRPQQNPGFLFRLRCGLGDAALPIKNLSTSAGLVLFVFLFVFFVELGVAAGKVDLASIDKDF
ncbi:MAG: hypothetical protein ACI92G_002898 [Candidatus Pelagisphaera sp.]|jgi:hypothetical protein